MRMKTKFALAGSLALFLAAGAAAQTAMVDGQVTRVDAAQGKITLRHGPIPKFDMTEGHTMVFQVSDPAMLTAVKVGDKVKFDADKVNGKFTIMKIEKAK
jgi:Cu/Ag efflux protein CusF